MLYSSGLRLLECLSLRVKDVDLTRHQLMVRRGKGNHDRVALLPARAREGLRAQLDEVEHRHRAELTAGRGEVDLPHALRTKMPQVATTMAWQYLFPASRPCTDPATGRPVLYHLHESTVQKAVHDAARSAQLDKRATCHTLRHSFATHLLYD
jgi:site-specific recombinase XerD